jgi:hypothetical protein
LSKAQQGKQLLAGTRLGRNSSRGGCCAPAFLYPFTNSDLPGGDDPCVGIIELANHLLRDAAALLHHLAVRDNRK